MDKNDEILDIVIELAELTFETFDRRLGKLNLYTPYPYANMERLIERLKELREE